MRAICTAFCALLAWSAVAPAHVYLPMTPAAHATTNGHTR